MHILLVLRLVVDVDVDFDIGVDIGVDVVFCASCFGVWGFVADNIITDTYIYA
jgi:hypothetical protein